MILYHRANAAKTILRYGFRDAEQFRGFESLVLRGVFISDAPLACMEEEKGSQVLKITLPDEFDISDYELIEESKPYREWCVPPELINLLGQVELREGEAELGTGQ